MAAYFRVGGAINLSPDGIPDLEVDFESEIDAHHQAGLTILGELITGPSAKEKIHALAEVATEG